MKTLPFFFGAIVALSLLFSGTQAHASVDLQAEVIAAIEDSNFRQVTGYRGLNGRISYIFEKGTSKFYHVAFGENHPTHWTRGGTLRVSKDLRNVELRGYDAKGKFVWHRLKAREKAAIREPRATDNSSRFRPRYFAPLRSDPVALRTNPVRS